MNGEQKAKKQRRSRKQRLAGIIAVTAGFLTLFSLALLLLPAAKNALVKKKETFPLTGSGSKLLYTPDFEENIFEDEAYLEKNRKIRYTMHGVSTYLTAETITELDAQAKFFAAYFDTVIAGDYKNYPSFFTERYRKKKDAFDKRAQDKKPFTPQKIYDIDVRYLDGGQAENADGNVTYTFFNVEYKIMKNNGTFRRDIDDEGVVPLVFGLMIQNGKVQINDISTYDSLSKSKEWAE